MSGESGTNQEPYSSVAVGGGHMGEKEKNKY
jgi:hypothetical protein